MKLSNNFLHLFLLGLVFATVLAKPMPQDAEDDGDKDVTTKTDEKEDEEEVADPLEAVGEAFAGFLSLLGGVAKAAEKVASDPEVQSTVAEVVDAGIKGSADAVNLAAGLAQEAPKIVEENRPFVEGLAKTISETSGFVSGSLEEIEQTAKLASVFAEAYTNDSLSRLDNFLKTFNRRLKCNTTCEHLKGEKKEKCEERYCSGFVKPKTKKQLEDEKLKFVEEYDYSDYYDEEEESEDDSSTEDDVSLE